MTDSEYSPELCPHCHEEFHATEIYWHLIEDHEDEPNYEAIADAAADLRQRSKN